MRRTGRSTRFSHHVAAPVDFLTKDRSETPGVLYKFFVGVTQRRRSENIELAKLRTEINCGASHEGPRVVLRLTQDVAAIGRNVASRELLANDF
jgi:hypothetical protein